MGLGETCASLTFDNLVKFVHIRRTQLAYNTVIFLERDGVGHLFSGFFLIAAFCPCLIYALSYRGRWFILCWPIACVVAFFVCIIIADVQGIGARTAWCVVLRGGLTPIQVAFGSALLFLMKSAMGIEEFITTTGDRMMLNQDLPRRWFFNQCLLIYLLCVLAYGCVFNSWLCAAAAASGIKLMTACVAVVRAETSHFIQAHYIKYVVLSIIFEHIPALCATSFYFQGHAVPGRVEELFYYLAILCSLACTKCLLELISLLFAYAVGKDDLGGSIKLKPCSEPESGMQVFRTGAFGMNVLAHHGVFVGRWVCDDRENKRSIPENTLASKLVEMLVKKVMYCHADSSKPTEGLVIVEVNGEKMEQEILDASRDDLCGPLQVILHSMQKQKCVQIRIHDATQRMHVDIEMSAMDLVEVFFAVEIEHVPRFQVPLVRSSREENILKGDMIVNCQFSFDSMSLFVAVRTPTVGKPGETKIKWDPKGTLRVIEMNGVPGKVAILAISWENFQRSGNASGTVSVNLKNIQSGGEGRGKVLVRTYPDTSQAGLIENIRKALSQEFVTTQYGLHENCETFAHWCCAPTKDRAARGFSGGRSPQAEGVATCGLAVGTVIAEGLWIRTSSANRLPLWFEMVISMLVLAAVRFLQQRAITRASGAEAVFEDLEFVSEDMELENLRRGYSRVPLQEVAPQNQWPYPKGHPGSLLVEVEW